MSSDVVGSWEVPLSDGLHLVEFEHGTATGKRVVRVDDKEVFRIDWMFKLVGDQEFKIGSTPCRVRIEPISGFSYQYSLVVDGKSLEDFTQKRATRVCTWNVGDTHRIVMVWFSVSNNTTRKRLESFQSKVLRLAVGAVPWFVWNSQLRRELGVDSLEDHLKELTRNHFEKLPLYPATGEFVDGGTETHFQVGNNSAYIKAVSSCNKKEGLIYTLIYNEQIIPQEMEEAIS